MKKFAAILAVIMLLLCGCAPQGKFTDKNAARVFGEELDVEEDDAQDVLDALKDGDLPYFEDGVWARFDGKQTRKFRTRCGIGTYIGSVKKAESSICYIEGEGLKTRETVIVMVLTFKDEKDAEDFLEETYGIWEDTAAFFNDYDSEEGDDEILAWWKGFGEDFFMGAYKSGRQVLAMCAVNDGDYNYMDDVCDAFDLDNPSELAK